MPLPTPNDGEEESDFISRCMGSEAAQEFDDQKQRSAVCYSQWRGKHPDSGKTQASHRLDIIATVEFDLET